MQLQVGVYSLAELNYYLKLGAGEFYCGISSVVSHVDKADNFSRPDEIGEAARIAHAAGKKIFFAANEIYWDTPGETSRMVEKLATAGVDGVILRDLALLEFIKKRKLRLQLILSSLAICLNGEALAYYKSMGITRIALPEHLPPAAAREVVLNRLGVESEVFYFAREACVNINSFCRLECPGQLRRGCKDVYDRGGAEFVMPRLSVAECMVRLYDFYEMGVPVLKIGRVSDHYHQRLAFKEASEILALLRGGAGREAFVKEALRVHRAFDKGYVYIRSLRR